MINQIRVLMKFEIRGDWCSLIIATKGTMERGFVFMLCSARKKEDNRKNNKVKPNYAPLFLSRFKYSYSNFMFYSDRFQMSKLYSA